MTHDEIINAWNKQADYMNKWNSLGEDEKLEWAIKLERKACAKVCKQLSEKMTDMAAWGAQECLKAIKARGRS